MSKTKYERPDHVIAIGGMAHQERFNDREQLARAFEAFWDDAGLSVRGYITYRGEKSYLTPLPGRGVVELIAENVNKLMDIVLDRGGFQFTRMPKRFLLHEMWGVNVDVHMRLPEPARLDEGVNLLKAMVPWLGLFWGEVNDERITKKPTFCGINEHINFVPNMGSANYFGPEYVRYFGGVDRFRTAPHLKVEPFHEGLLTRITECRDNDEFKARQAEIRKFLGERLFDSWTPDKENPTATGRNDPNYVPLWHELFWSDVPCDNRAATALFQALVNLGQGQKSVIQTADGMTIEIEKRGELPEKQRGSPKE